MNLLFADSTLSMEEHYLNNFNNFEILIIHIQVLLVTFKTLH